MTPSPLHRNCYIAGMPRSIWSVAFNDLSEGLSLYRLWMLLGWRDIRQRYRRSILGPFWLTLSTGIMVAMMSILYGRLFKLPLNIYIPFLAAGTIIWGFIASLLNDGCSTFMDAQSLIKQTRMPFTVHVCRTVWRNLLVFFHNIVILIPVWLIFGSGLHWAGLMSAGLALLLIAINGFWVGLVLGPLCARFRDIGPIINNLVQVVYFVTPIMWLPSILEGKGIAWWLVVINPFYHFLEILRAPLLGKPVPIDSWAIAMCVTLAGTLLGVVMIGRYKNRIAYWL